MDADSMADSGKRWRKLHVATHPMHLKAGEGCLWTAPVNRLYRGILRSIVLRQGAYLEEVTGAGKTCAMVMIQSRLLQDLPGFIVFSYRQPTNQCTSVRAFFKLVLLELRHNELNGETIDIRLRVRRRLEEMALRSSFGMVWVWVDEAQAMSDSEFLFLRDIQNELRSANLDLVTLLSGEAPHLETRLNEIRGDERSCIRERFAVRKLSLDAYALEDVRGLLDLMDRQIWPANSGVAWTQFFFPEAYASGFRLIDEAQNCMNALRDAKMLCPGERCQIRLLKNTVSCFCHDNSDNDVSNLQISSNAWRNAVHRAAGQLLDHGRYEE